MRYKVCGVSYVYGEPALLGDTVDESQPVNEAGANLGKFSDYMQVFKQGSIFICIPHVTAYRSSLLDEIQRLCKDRGIQLVKGVFFGSNSIGVPGYYKFSPYSKARLKDGSYASLRLAACGGYYGWFSDFEQLL